MLLRLFNAMAWTAGILGGAGVWLLGPQCGFQHYLIVVPPVLALQSGRPFAVRLLVVALAILAYLTLDVVGPVWTLPANVAQVLYTVNAVMGLLLLSGMAFVHASQFNSVQARLQRSVATDPLTGLLNRHSWAENAEGLLARTRGGERQAAVGLLIAGVDHLKPINDRHGNATGDQVLCTVAAALQHGLRDRDLLARWGGDQFIALFACSDASTVRMVGERLRALVQAATVRVAGSGVVLPLTISIGATVLGENEPLDAVIARADKALGDAKRNGRNRVMVSRG